MNSGQERVGEVFEILDANELNVVQELSIIDISLKIIAADEKEEMEALINFQYHFADNELYKKRHLKRFDFLHKLLNILIDC